MTIFLLLFVESVAVAFSRGLTTVFHITTLVPRVYLFWCQFLSVCVGLR